MNVTYDNVLLTISTVAELAILYLVWAEGRKVVTNVNEIREATTGTLYGSTDDLVVGNRVQIVQPQPGAPRHTWGYGQEVYVIREVDRVRNRAIATPVLSPPDGPTPTVDGPMRGPNSPFKKLPIPS